ncbi:MAG: hypothetical protein U1A78_00165 [Polyangia bacterium]
MSQNNDNLNGALTGIALAAATHWARYEDDSQRRLRNVRLDAEEALDLIRDMQGRGDVIRSRLPTVMDAQVGISIASPQPAAAAVIPSTTPLVRPDLAAQMETAVSDMTWPPEPGQYDDRGMVKRAGELTSLFLSLTYEEIRAFVQGLAQTRPPSRECKVQIFYAANALVAQLCGQKLTWQQYKDAWARLFGVPGGGVGGGNTPVVSPDSHSDPAREPKVIQGSLATDVQSVVPLSPTYIPGYPFANRNTDAAMRFRVTIGANVVPASSTVVRIQFGTEYKFRDLNNVLQPVQPCVQVNAAGAPRIYADQITSTTFSLVNAQSLSANTAYDVFITATAGHAVET